MVELSVIRDLVAIFGVIAGFSYYVMTVRNQNKTRQTQLFMQLYQSRYNAEGVKQFWRAVMLEWDDFDDYMKRYGPFENPEITDELAIITAQWNYFDGLGILLKDRMLDENTVYKMIGVRILMVWFKCEAIIDKVRFQRGEPSAGGDYMEGFEYLANRMIEIRKKKGIPLPTSWIHPTTTRYKHLIQ